MSAQLLVANVRADNLTQCQTTSPKLMIAIATLQGYHVGGGEGNIHPIAMRLHTCKSTVETG